MNFHNKVPQLHGLTIFRFVAAFYVFLFHCNIRYGIDFRDYVGIYYNDYILRLIKNGAAGMTFFFVLSGFVMAYASRKGIREDYFKARIARIYPAYLVLGVITLPYIFMYDAKTIMANIFMFITSTQSWFTGSFTLWNFSGSWSVSTEMFFYLSFPLLFPLVNKSPYFSLCVALLISSLIIPVSDIINKNITFPVWHLYISPIHRIPEFIAGVALGCMYNRGFRIINFRLSFLIISLFALAVLAPNNNEGYIRNNVIIVPATCYLVYYFATANIKGGWASKPFIYLGKLSYSLYLMQIPIMLYIVRYMSFMDSYPAIVKWAILFLMNVVMASLCYHFVEDNKRIKSFIMNFGLPKERTTAI